MIRRVKRIASWLHISSNLKQAVSILFITILISNILGLARNVIIANRVGVTFGTIGPLDNYYAAFVLPDLIYSIIIMGALNSAILPLLVHIDEREPHNFWKTFNRLLSTGLVVLISALVILYLIMPFAISRLFPGFSAENQHQTIVLARVLLLSPVFFTISQLFTAALQAKKYFLAPALAPIIYNLAIIFGAALIPRFGLTALVFGVIFGAAGHFLIQLPTLIKLDWRLKFELAFHNPQIRQILRLMIPRAIALSGTQLLLIVFYHLASKIQNGSISIYRLTDDLQSAPVLLLANTVAMAILPDFARRIAQDRIDDFYYLIARSTRLLIYLFLPITIILMTLNTEIIGIYLAIGHGIKLIEVQIASQTFDYFLISIFFQGMVLLLARAYFARSDTVRPTVFSLIGITVSWILGAILINYNDLGVAGLSLAFSIGSAINAILLWIGLRIPFSLIVRDQKSNANLPIVIYGVLITGIIATITKPLFTSVIGLSDLKPTIQSVLIILAVFTISGVFYIGWSKLFNLEQWQTIIKKTSTTK